MNLGPLLMVRLETKLCTCQELCRNFLAGFIINLGNQLKQQASVSTIDYNGKKLLDRSELYSEVGWLIMLRCREEAGITRQGESS